MTGLWSDKNIPKVNSSSPQWVIVSRLGWSIDLANRYRLKSVKPITLIIILLVSEKQKSQIVPSKTLIKRSSEIEVAPRLHGYTTCTADTDDIAYTDYSQWHICLHILEHVMNFGSFLL